MLIFKKYPNMFESISGMLQKGLLCFVFPPFQLWAEITRSSRFRLETKTNGTKTVIPIRPIACTAGVMDLDQVVVRMV